MGSTRRLLSIVAVAVAAALALALAGPSAGTPAAVPCVRMPAEIPRGRLLGNRATIHVPVGAIVYAALIEPEEYTGSPYPIGFPWETARSTDPSVLGGVHLCARQELTTLIDVVTAFRAEHVGSARVLAPLVPRWRSVRGGPRPYEARVDIDAAR